MRRTRLWLDSVMSPRRRILESATKNAETAIRYRQAAEEQVSASENQLQAMRANLRGSEELSEMIRKRSIEIRSEFPDLLKYIATRTKGIVEHIAMLEQKVATLRRKDPRLQDEEQRLKDEEQRLQDEEQRLSAEEQRLKDDWQRLKDADTALLNEKQRLQEAIAEVEKRTAQQKSLSDDLRLHWPWLDYDVTRLDNESRCFAPVSGRAPAPSSVDWGTTNDVYAFISDVAALSGDKIARNALKTELLTTAVRRLAQLDLSPQAGGQTTCFVGERGGGKSHTLKLIVAAAAEKFRNVVPVYLDYSGYNNAVTPLPLPSALVEEALARRGVTLESPLNNMKDVQKALRDRGLRLLLVVDELDQAYQALDETVAGKLRIESFSLLLQELNDIGSSQTGEIVAYVCGSSGSLPLLISGRKDNEDLCKRFAMMKYAIDLDGHKYRQRHLPSTWITSEEEFVETLKALHPTASEPAMRAKAREFAIIYGCNLRTLRNLRFDAKETPKFDWGLRADDAKQKYANIIKPLDAKLCDVNKDLLDLLAKALKSPTPNFENIDVFSMMKGLKRDEVIGVTGVQHLQSIDILCELSWYAGSVQNPEAELFPSSALSLLVDQEPDLAKPARTVVERARSAFKL